MKKTSSTLTPEYQTPCVEVLNAISTAALAASGEEGVTIGDMTEIDENW